MRFSTRGMLGFGFVLAACGGTVKNDPAASDTTAAAVNLLVKGVGATDLEVQEQVVPVPPPPTGTFGDPAPDSLKQFSILATATDNESGIRNIKLNLTRTVCFVGSGGALLQAYEGTKLRKEANYTDPNNAPRQASLGETGVIDNRTDTVSVDPANLLLRVDGNGNLKRGVGVRTRWNMEATNFKGGISRSASIVVNAGNTSCVTQP